MLTPSKSQSMARDLDLDLESRSRSTTETLTPEVKNETSIVEKDVKQYQQRIPTWRKCIILFVTSWMSLAVTFSSTTLLSATPEIAAEFNTTVEILDVTNSGVLIGMGLSSLIWGPLNNLIGRRIAYNIAILVLAVCSAGTAAAINMPMFTAFRILGGLTGTSFMVTGQTILADNFEPTVRGTAMGFFMAGSVTGPAIGPCIGGLIVTFAHWRIIFWLQVAMAVLGLVLSLLFIPDIKKEGSTNDQMDFHSHRSFLSALSVFNPVKVLRQFIYPNVLFCYITCGILSAFQYALLTSARSIFNPRFHLTTALVSGLFYLAPGAGFLLGSIVGGKLSDRTVKKYIRRRGGLRLPQDRLNSGLIALVGVLPAAILIYAWTLQEETGGMVVPIIAAFFCGIGLTGVFNGLNTYAAEAIPQKRHEVISGKYVIQYFCAAGSSAAVVPLVNCIGTGWTFTIYVVLILIAGAMVFAITRRGLDMQRWAERKFHLDDGDEKLEF